MKEGKKTRETQPPPLMIFFQGDVTADTVHAIEDKHIYVIALEGRVRIRFTHFEGTATTDSPWDKGQTDYEFSKNTVTPQLVRKKARGKWKYETRAGGIGHESTAEMIVGDDVDIP